VGGGQEEATAGCGESGEEAVVSGFAYLLAFFKAATLTSILIVGANGAFCPSAIVPADGSSNWAASDHSGSLSNENFANQVSGRVWCGGRSGWGRWWGWWGWRLWLILGLSTDLWWASSIVVAVVEHGDGRGLQLDDDWFIVVVFGRLWLGLGASLIDEDGSVVLLGWCIDEDWSAVLLLQVDNGWLSLRLFDTCIGQPDRS